MLKKTIYIVFKLIIFIDLFAKNQHLFQTELEQEMKSISIPANNENGGELNKTEISPTAELSFEEQKSTKGSSI